MSEEEGEAVPAAFDEEVGKTALIGDLEVVVVVVVVVAGDGVFVFVVVNKFLLVFGFIVFLPGLNVKA